PTLPIDRILRRERAQTPSAAPDERPLAIVERVGSALRLSAVDARAAAGGCAAGMALAAARAVCPALRVVPAAPHEDAELLEVVADWCDRYTPLVALDPPQGLLLDVSGCAQLFGGEAALLAGLVGALRGRGFEARAAIADAAGPARALAWFTGGGVAPPGEERRLVAALPVAALALDEPGRLGLLRAGLKTVGEVAVRGRSELGARFAAGFLAALDATLGIADPPISPRRPAPSFVVERRFAEPIATVEAALASLAALADALARRLEAAGQGLTAAEAALFRADGKVERVDLGTGAPTRDPKLLMRLFGERLDALADPLDPGFGYDLMRLSALAAEPLVPRAPAFD
ncbi:Y-family DNA polymerase, partial [Hansschlegelia zhihuaiae]|uniref:Y-family DNA polymerase n=1 Tax=Hansschlegelia zhihuaiae TaxID=405005 RepID=UPI0013E8B1F3